ncbi:hypothetical protein DdX_14889 [Ditylenchus destructor]|uniref:Uncharacterized protein n=1 Tax=Ditylenchus destructor TaxID=166010 RepID=A0AAD4R1C1_9BILA|nr:hypothetical protein DdX_14889 [Ditylenchus destructor]
MNFVSEAKGGGTRLEAFKAQPEKEDINETAKRTTKIAEPYEESVMRELRQRKKNGAWVGLKPFSAAWWLVMVLSSNTFSQ